MGRQGLCSRSASLPAWRGDRRGTGEASRVAGMTAPIPPPIRRDPATALLAFQLLEHWGNRAITRLSPRAEVLAAALLAGVPGGVVKGCGYGRYVDVLLARICGTSMTSEDDCTDLAHDPRYALLPRGGDAANRQALACCFAVAVALLEGSRGPVTLGPIAARDGEVSPVLRRADERAWRLHPWLFPGRRLSVHAEVSGVVSSFTLLATAEPL